MQRAERDELGQTRRVSGREVKMEERTTISTYEDGPFLVTGADFRVVGAGGGEGGPGREGDGRSVPLRGFYEEAVLRRGALEGRFPGGDR
jgi:hypothetical protein